MVASSKLAQTRRIGLKYHMKEYKGNHSQKLLEEVIQDVVGVLLVLTILLNVFFSSKYLLHSNYLIKSKISSQSTERFGYRRKKYKEYFFAALNTIISRMGLLYMTIKTKLLYQMISSFGF